MDAYMFVYVYACYRGLFFSENLKRDIVLSMCNVCMGQPHV